MSFVTIPVSARSGDYVVHVEPGARTRLGAVLDDAGLVGLRVAVTSPRVWAAQGRSMRSTGRGSVRLLVPDGEPANW